LFSFILSLYLFFTLSLSNSITSIDCEGEKRERERGERRVRRDGEERRAERR